MVHLIFDITKNIDRLFHSTKGSRKTSSNKTHNDKNKKYPMNQQMFESLLIIIIITLSNNDNTMTEFTLITFSVLLLFRGISSQYLF